MDIIIKCKFKSIENENKQRKIKSNEMKYINTYQTMESELSAVISKS